MAEHALDVVPGAGIAMTEGTGNKLFISALNNGNIYYGYMSGGNYHGPETNSYFFLTYYTDGSSTGSRTVNYSIFVKTEERIVEDSTVGSETDDYTVTYCPVDSAVKYVLEGSGKVPKDAPLGDGTLLVNITSWTRKSTNVPDNDVQE